MNSIRLKIITVWDEGEYDVELASTTTTEELRQDLIEYIGIPKKKKFTITKKSINEQGI